MSLVEEVYNEEEQDDIFRGIGVEVELRERADFLKVRETLTRIGDVEGDSLLQSCCIFHKHGRYVIAHFKEMRQFDGDDVELSADEEAVRNRVAQLLHDWGLLVLAEQIEGPMASTHAFRILPFRDKDRYKLVPRYEIGRKRAGEWREDGASL